MPPLISMDRPPKQKFNKEMRTLNDQGDFTNLFRAFHPEAAEYTFFSSAHGIFSRMDHIVGHKSVLYKQKKLRSHQAYFQTMTTRKKKYMDIKKHPTKE